MVDANVHSDPPTISVVLAPRQATSDTLGTARRFTKRSSGLANEFLHGKYFRELYHASPMESNSNPVKKETAKERARERERKRERWIPRRVITKKESIRKVGGRETKVESRSKGTREEAGRREREGEREATNRSAMPGREGDGRRGRKRGEREQEERHEREPGTSGVLGRSVERAITSTRDAWALSLDGQAESVSRSYARPRALPASPPERNARTSLTPE